MRGGHRGLTVLLLASGSTTSSIHLSPRSWPSSRQARLVTQPLHWPPLPPAWPLLPLAPAPASTGPGPNLCSSSHCLKSNVLQVQSHPHWTQLPLGLPSWDTPTGTRCAQGPIGFTWPHPPAPDLCPTTPAPVIPRPHLHRLRHHHPPPGPMSDALLDQGSGFLS